MLYQDNTSATLLKENGRESIMKRPKHIHIQYICIKDKVNSGEETLEHCPTGIMLADYSTKPLQGAKFREFHAWIMGLPEEGLRKVTQPKNVSMELKGILKNKPTKEPFKLVESVPQPRPIGNPRLRSTGVCWSSQFSSSP